MPEYEGGCHCGAVRFRVRTSERKVLECNCSICRQKGFLHLIVKSDEFELLEGEEALTTYTFNTHSAKHHFCSHCGIHSFYVPRSHPDGFDINVRCLDSVPDGAFDFESFDGRDWESNIHSIAGYVRGND